jgi:hypothetical protein
LTWNVGVSVVMTTSPWIVVVLEQCKTNLALRPMVSRAYTISHALVREPSGGFERSLQIWASAFFF